MTPLADFELAPLEGFATDVFNSTAPEVDAFILSLALAYNDFKGIEWVFLQLDKGKPETPGISAYDGQFFGMRIHMTRLSVAFLHELVKAIETASTDGVLAHAEFRNAKELLTEEANASWEEFVSVCLGGQAAPDKEFLGWLARVRNSAAYHYYQPKGLHKGYLQFFNSEKPSDHNQFAYASLGNTLEVSRFYFADAAIAASYDNTDLLARAGSVRREVNKVLRRIVEAYLRYRARLLAGETKSPLTRSALPRKPRFS